MQASEQTEDKQRQGCYEKCEGCDNTREECACPCSMCGGTGYVVTVSGGPFNITGKRPCVVCNFE